MERSKQIVRVSVVGILVNLVLVAFKAAIGYLTGSIAVLMDAINNLSDAMSSVITILGTKLAGKDPDKKHPYGYGQIEYVTSITISAIVIATGITSFRESFEKAIHPETANYTAISLIIISVAVAAKFLLGKYVKREGKKYNSESLIASGTDALFDSVISLSTVAAAFISLLWHISIEGWLGLVISVIICKAGIEILLDSLSGIIGARVDSELSRSLKAKMCEYPEVSGAYDLVLHRYGPDHMIGSVHLELPDTMTARDIHILTRKITEDIYLNYGIIMTIGIYASNTDNELYADMKNTLYRLASQNTDILHWTSAFPIPWQNLCRTSPR